MERLTTKSNSRYCDITHCKTSLNDEGVCIYGTCLEQEMWKKLRAYEDSGLEPEEVAVLAQTEPLTLDELRKMVKCPVWIIPQNRVRGGRKPKWALFSGLFAGDLCLFQTASGCSEGYKASTYGKTWLAYRNRPKEASAT